MASIKNVIEKVEFTKVKINHRYGLTVGNAAEIREKSSGDFDMICNSFAFGYMQGMKAARAEMKKAGIA